MPISFLKNDKDFQLGIWRMEEPLDDLLKMIQLSSNDLKTLGNFKSEYRKREWIAVRIVTKQLLNIPEVSIVYEENGKPRLADSDFSISISHTKNFVSVLLSKYKNAGIDIETIQPRIEKIAKRFVTKQEELFIEPDKKIIYQHVIWGTKEVLFKIYSKGELNFLDHLHVEKFQLEEKGELVGRIEKENFKKSLKVFYELTGDKMLVYSMS